MSSVEIAIVRRKLGVLIENLKALKPIEEMSRTEYSQDVYKRKATERLLQELIEAAIDINTHLIVQTGSPAPDSYYESFIRVGELKILASDLAERLAPSAGLRNRLVHEYDALDHWLVLEAVKTAGNLYPQYVREIEDYLSSGSLT
ncbi:MAG: hypothetical protein DDT18_00064 [Actinobacteria bacterium]|nr:hypothetical protein [Actinomycetota bacterium]